MHGPYAIGSVYAARRGNRFFLSFPIAAMRKSILPLLIAFVVLFAAGSFVTWMFFFTRERQYQKVEIPRSWLETADSSRYSVQPVALWRSYPDDSIMVFFPELEGGSQV